LIEVCPLVGRPERLGGDPMIVLGLDVHEQSVTAVAVDEAGRPLEEKAIAVGSDELLGWAAAWARSGCGG
jgi:hypothetical protein